MKFIIDRIRDMCRHTHNIFSQLLVFPKSLLEFYSFQHHLQIFNEKFLVLGLFLLFFVIDDTIPTKLTMKLNSIVNSQIYCNKDKVFTLQSKQRLQTCIGRRDGGSRLILFTPSDDSAMKIKSTNFLLLSTPLSLSFIDLFMIINPLLIVQGVNLQVRF